jgi:hypothetical protein
MKELVKEIVKIAKEVMASSPLPIGVENRNISNFNELAEAIKNKFITNARFKVISDRIKQNFESACGKQKNEIDSRDNPNDYPPLKDGRESYFSRYVYERDTNYTLSSMQSLNKLLKFFKNQLEIEQNENVKKDIKEYLEFLESWVQTRDMLIEAKGYAVKRQEIKKQEDEKKKSEFVKIISSGAVKKTHETLVKIVESIKPEFIKKKADWLIKTAENFIDKKWVEEAIERNKGKKDKSEVKFNLYYYLKHIGAPIAQELMAILKLEDADGKGIEPTLKPDAKETARKYGEAIYNEVSNKYLAKNIDKLALILQNKNSGLKNISIDDIEQRFDTFSSTVTFDFDDDTYFSVINKAVGKMSQNGVWFYQFPTTFHNVVFKDGSRKAMVTEESMVNVWSKEV